MKRKVLYVVFIFLCLIIVSCAETYEDDVKKDKKRIMSQSIFVIEAVPRAHAVGDYMYFGLLEYWDIENQYLEDVHTVSRSDITGFSVFPEGIIEFVGWNGNYLEYVACAPGIVIVTMIYKNGLNVVSARVKIE